MPRATLAFFLVISSQVISFAAIPKPDDAPLPLSPADSLRQVKVPPGFQLKLVASEPLITEPTGVCFDERGRTIICEMHGYNLEGQYDVDELNKTGQLDTIPRVKYASPEALKKAHADSYGTVKMLIDKDHDGLMDSAEIWADRLPPCQGICAARNGVIVVCAPDIMYLADLDGDGKAEIKEKLYTGLVFGPVDRGVNCPMWALDNWIYVGHGHDGGRVTGPHMKSTYVLPSSDFRIKADGTAVEAVSGKTRSIGHTFTEWGHRIVVSTPTAAIAVAPLPWDYLSRNRELIVPNLEKDLNTDPTCYPISEAHPWRTKRHAIKAYSTKGGIFGAGETTPNGFFTSLCSPLVYRDDALPGLKGQELACEPAQNFVHRAIISRDGGTGLKMTRVPGEEKSEFLASKDTWFHPISLTHGYDGSVYLVDFYREIIEDYAAVPRHLQQIYGLMNGHDKGRIYKLVHDKMPKAPSADMTKLSSEQLASEVESNYFWRRETARRLIIDLKDKSAAAKIASIISQNQEPFAAINALYTLDGLNALNSDVLIAGLKHRNPSVRIYALRIADQYFKSMPRVLDAALALKSDADANVLLQLALSLGETDELRGFEDLMQLAKSHGKLEYMPTAVMSSIGDRSVETLRTLLSESAKKSIGDADSLFEPLCAVIGARRKTDEIKTTLELFARIDDAPLKRNCLRSFQSQFKRVADLGLGRSSRKFCDLLATSSDAETSRLAKSLIVLLHLEKDDERITRLTDLGQSITNVKMPIKNRLAAIREMAAENEPVAIRSMLRIFNDSSPQIRDLILETIFARRDNLPTLLELLEKDEISAAVLNGLQREEILSIAALKPRAEKLFKSLEISDEIKSKYLKALEEKADLAQGEKLFRAHCANCHNVRGIGFSVGPNLTAEFQRAKEAFLKDILSPSAVISQGYTTYIVEDNDGNTASGLLTEYSTSYSLRQAGGKSVSVLRKNVVDHPKALFTSLMPDNFHTTLSPRDVADIIEWIRTPLTNIVVLDNNPEFLNDFREGPGTAQFVPMSDDQVNLALKVNPPEKSGTKINGWEFNIRENPGPGEYRYVRFTWKIEGATGVIAEFSNNATWPHPKDPSFRYSVGEIGTRLNATEVSKKLPTEWTTVTRDLWKDFGNSKITGFSIVTFGGATLIDKVEFLQAISK